MATCFSYRGSQAIPVTQLLFTNYFKGVSVSIASPEQQIGEVILEFISFYEKMHSNLVN